MRVDVLRCLFALPCANRDHAQLNPAEIVILHTLASRSKEIRYGDIHNVEIYFTLCKTYGESDSLEKPEHCPSFQVHGFQITQDDCHKALKHLREMQLITDGWNPHHSRITNKGLLKLGLESAGQLGDLSCYLRRLTDRSPRGFDGIPINLTL